MKDWLTYGLMLSLCSASRGLFQINLSYAAFFLYIIKKLILTASYIEDKDWSRIDIIKGAFQIVQSMFAVS